jgi:CheY-like chemotaxis protein
MPRLDGVEFYLHLQQGRPALAERVIFLSGDISHLAGRGLSEVPRDRVLVKPVELSELEQRILTFVREKAA